MVQAKYRRRALVESLTFDVGWDRASRVKIAQKRESRLRRPCGSIENLVLKRSETGEGISRYTCNPRRHLFDILTGNATEHHTAFGHVAPLECCGAE